MSDQVIPSSVVARVRKLLALSEGSTFEGEASSAALKAAEILREYNLSLAELGAEQPSGDTARQKLDRVLDVRHAWQSELLSTLARNNFCVFWTDGVFDTRVDGKASKKRWRNRARFIGRQVNLTVTLETFQYLSDAMERLCPYADRRDRSSRSWFDGCVETLSSRLAMKRWEAEAASRKARAEAPRGDGSSVALADVYSSEEDLNYDMRWGYEPGTTAARRAAQAAAPAAPRAPAKPLTAEEAAKKAKDDARWEAKWKRESERRASRVDWSAREAGAAAGRSIGLDTQVKAGPENKKLA